MYVGVTNDLSRRLYEHKNKLIKGFTEKYNLNKLVYFEETRDVQSALAREKEIKKRRREKKDALVQSVNPELRDISDEGKDFSLTCYFTIVYESGTQKNCLLNQLP